MADYYLYLLNREGRIIRRIDLQACTDDDHARELAAAHSHQARMELWRGDRLVQTFDARSAD